MAERFHRLLRWPLWSWRNLTLTVVAVLVSLGVIGRIGTVLGGVLPSEAATSLTAEVTHPITTP